MDNIKNIIIKQKEYFNRNKTKDLHNRKDALNKLKQSILNNKNGIVEALNNDLAKSEFEAYTTEIGDVLSEISLFLKKINKWSKDKKVRTPSFLYPAKSFIMKEPYGIVLIIGPFNYPFNLVMKPLIGAIAAGNTVIVKPSELSPNVANIIKKVLDEAFDQEYVATILGDAEVTSSLLEEKFDYIFFTGGAKIGKIIMQAAAKNLTPITLELGGKSPAVVSDAANIKIACQRIARGKFMNAGQTCVAPDYVFVEEKIFNKFIDGIKDTIVEFYGKDIKGNKDLGRIINKRHHDRLNSLLEKEKKHIIFGGQTDIENLYISPTLLTDINFDSPIMEEEIFGPILPILKYKDLDKDVIKFIKNGEKPLALYLFTGNKSEEIKILKEISFGGGMVNDTLLHLANPYLPFGGVGNSGIGAYHGKHSFDLFSHKKSIVKRPLNIQFDLTKPPYKNKLKFIEKYFK
ncbi:aldehyde dehydrogenase [Peptostreptococcus equinus]|uniref:Aldehyde dehydrogenase n=1 Tax=Peptostreptococcus equinus TaxID=3003601 RepID=A0ABY7JTC8_9FIRM|nr:aldehyde dehydrogenase [Peptostreptococcus sp. CBA3647]WAW15225.1 aldehyde dehydrogenase [Peptostreptococcus sp. CBA3647]